MPESSFINKALKDLYPSVDEIEIGTIIPILPCNFNRLRIALSTQKAYKSPHSNVL